ncbi:acetate kinase [Breoghania corrubedonensis]|uniref:Acetate kinase n=1 Tax=Breoghania corrubedonensis TaxID=665038 RepID=A0A2T5VG17_9HYPH|nr:acetate/propionate family kinase [Breoghania corrubedonensis]PTW62701.1 acetate kinase [Breoghania corrubedonensis]
MRSSVLVLNAGSSSIKFALYAVAHVTIDAVEICRGKVTGIGTTPAFDAESGDGQGLSHRPLDPSGISDHASALAVILDFLHEAFPDQKVDAVGHRVVHGGPHHFQPLLLTEANEAELDLCAALAPLHAPHNMAGIRAAQAAFPAVPQIACFDTAFHRHHPWVSDTFALPRNYFDEGVRRYGFHGLSYEYVSQKLREIAPDVAQGRVIVGHLGAGASICGIREGRSVCSSMGFTALDGLPMGTRCGQIDPGVLLYLLGEKGMSVEEVTDLLYNKSGLLGLSGISSDMRTLEKSDDPRAREAIDYFAHRIRREIGALAAVIGGVDALVFTGGIGENSPLLREIVCQELGWLGFALDEEKNAANEIEIAAPSSVRCFAIPTNEEIVIARHTARLAGYASSAA